MLPGFELRGPDARLRSCLVYYWALQAPGGPAARFLPALAPVLIISRRPAPALIYQGLEQPQPWAFVKSVWSEQAVLTGGAPVDNIGIAFQPGAARALLGISLEPLRDQVIDVLALGDRPLRDLVHRVRAASNLEQAAASLDAFFLRRAAEISDHQRARAALSLMNPCQSGGHMSVAGLSATLGVSERQLRRLFLEEIGASPSLCRRILRLQVAEGLLKSDRPLAEVALQAGYYDQAHFSREFKAMAGVTPRQRRSEERSIDGLFEDGRSIQDR